MFTFVRSSILSSFLSVLSVVSQRLKSSCFSECPMKIFSLLLRSRLSRATLVYTLLFFSVIIYFEFIDVWSNASNWNLTTASSKAAPDTDIRILIVADPQLLGEHGELPFLGVFTRWHADRYVAQNFRVAKDRTNPRVIIFLGDLFDEGSTATEAEAARYFRRFKSVFQLEQYSQGEDEVLHIYIPGDNDIGGEREKIKVPKLKWFSSLFGDLKLPVLLKTPTLNLKFTKVLPVSDRLMQQVYNRTEAPALDTPGEEHHGIHIALNHIPCLHAYTPCSEMLLKKKPNILFSGHTHVAEYVQYNHEAKVKYVLPNLFLPGLEPIDGTREAAQRMGLGLTSSSLRLDLSNNSVFHELLTPTCSYRMGERHPGFGLFTLDKAGHYAEYRVLWLPNGFKPLFIYIGFYIASKIIFTPWILWKVLLCCWPRFRRFFNSQARIIDVTSSDKAHLV